MNDDPTEEETDDLKDKIHDLLTTKLNIPSNRRKHIYSSVFRLQHLIRTRPNSEKPIHKLIGKKAAIEEIEQLRKTAKKLESIIDGLHRNTMDALCWGEWTYTGKDWLRDVLMRTESASNYLKAGARGAPKKSEDRRLTKAAAEVFTQLTGKKPTITKDPDTSETRGPFVEFLHDLFQISGTTASASSQAVEYQDRLREKKTRKTPH